MRAADVVESRLARSKLDSASKKNAAKSLATSLRIEFLEARMYAQSSGCVYAVKFRCSASPGRACMSASIASIMSKSASCVIQRVGEWDTSWRGENRSVFSS